MIRKIIGILLILLSVLMIVGGITNGTLFSDEGSAAATYGQFLGTILPVVVNIWAAIFLLGFDKIYKISYIDGFHARKKQNSKIVLFTVIYALLTFASGMGGVMNMSYDDNFVFVMIKGTIYILPPFITFAVMLGAYVVPYNTCVKHCQLSASTVEEYLSPSELYYAYTQDSSVVANSQVIFFPKSFCAIPFDMVAEIKFYNGLEKDIIFVLTNGKKVELVANQKQYEGTIATWNAHHGVYPT